MKHGKNSFCFFFKNVEYAVFEMYFANTKYLAIDYNKDTLRGPTTNSKSKLIGTFNTCNISPGQNLQDFF